MSLTSSSNKSDLNLSNKSDLNLSNKSDLNLSNKLDLLIEMNKNLLAQIAEQNKLIQELQKENKKISTETTKMALHVDFINSNYARIRQSAFFKTILG